MSPRFRDISYFLVLAGLAISCASTLNPDYCDPVPNTCKEGYVCVNHGCRLAPMPDDTQGGAGGRPTRPLVGGGGGGLMVPAASADAATTTDNLPGQSSPDGMAVDARAGVGPDLAGPLLARDMAPDAVPVDAPGSCGTNAQCPVDRPVCSNGVCGRCASNADCIGRLNLLVCLAATGACVECGKDVDCKLPGPGFCSPTGNRCVECLAATQCPDVRPICAADRCVTCTAGSQCTARAANLKVCAPVGRCLECDSNNDCSGATPGCLKAPGVLPRCAACSEDKHCPTTAPVCGPTTGVCGACTTDAQCVARDPNTRACVMGKCLGCGQHAHCTDAAKPLCGTTGVCVACSMGPVAGCGAKDMRFPACEAATGKCGCAVSCVVGVAKRCGTGGGVSDCVLKDSCPFWAPEVSCGGRKFCEQQPSGPTCRCPSPPAACKGLSGTYCASGTTIATCAPDTDNCLAINAGVTTCLTGQVCTGTAPGVMCKDTGNPYVVSSSPIQSATGVPLGAYMEFVFNEDMNQVATQNAYQSASSGITANKVTLRWPNARTLRVEPFSPLNCSFGNTINTPARSYVATITTAATDLAGNSLASEYTLEFTTCRTVETKLVASTLYSGTAWSDNNYDYVNPGVGDEPQNIERRTIVGFSISDIPSGASIDSATLRLLRSETVIGDPFTNLGSLYVGQIQPGVMSSSTFSSTQIGAESTLQTIVDQSVDVSTALRDSLPLAGDRRNILQYRMRFGTPTNADGIADVILPIISVSDASAGCYLQVKFTAP